MFGCNHRTASLDVRERFALADAQLEKLYCAMPKVPGLEECLILSTCNRIECYGAGQAIDHEAAQSIFCQTAGYDTALFAQATLREEGPAVVKHIFEVASGLDSQMVGETEILGQVKNAYAAAVERGVLGARLNRLFQKSFQAAKWVRTHTAIGRGQVSIGQVAGELAERIFGELAGCRLLVIGTGEVGEKTLLALRDRGAADITLASRTFENARRMAARYQGQAVEFETVPHLMHRFDIVVCSSASPDTLFSRQQMAGCLRQRGGLPLFVVDLAMPRNVDPLASHLTGLYLYNLDDLALIANENLRARQTEVEKCRAVLQERATYFWEGMIRRQLRLSHDSQPLPSRGLPLVQPGRGS